MIEINCHSSIKIIEDKVVYFDPYKITSALHDADYIFITHNHYDHFDLESINKIIKDTTLIIIPDSMAANVLGLLPSKNIRGIKPNEDYTINGLKIHTIPSYNVNKKYHLKEYNWVGYIIDLNNKIYYIAGDTDITEENKKVKCDVTFVPIGGTYTMDYKEAAELINIIKPQIAVPTHYGLITGSKEDGRLFKELVSSDIEVKIFI